MRQTFLVLKGLHSVSWLCRSDLLPRAGASKMWGCKEIEFGVLMARSHYLIFRISCQMKNQGPLAHKAREKLFLSSAFSLPAVVFFICYLMSERGGSGSNCRHSPVPGPCPWLSAWGVPATLPVSMPASPGVVAGVEGGGAESLLGGKVRRWVALTSLSQWTSLIKHKFKVKLLRILTQWPQRIKPQARPPSEGTSLCDSTPMKAAVL